MNTISSQKTAENKQSSEHERLPANLQNSTITTTILMLLSCYHCIQGLRFRENWPEMHTKFVARSDAQITLFEQSGKGSGEQIKNYFCEMGKHDEARGAQKGSVRGMQDYSKSFRDLLIVFDNEIISKASLGKLNRNEVMTIVRDVLKLQLAKKANQLTCN